MDDIKQFIKEHEKEMIRFWQDLVNIASSTYDDKSEIFARIDREIQEGFCKLRKHTLEAYCSKYCARPSIVSYITGPATELRPLVFMGHVDTVRTAASCTIHDGKIFGSGVLDMKGGIVIMIYTALALVKRGYSRPIKLIFTSGEEVGHTDDSSFAAVMQDECLGAAAAFSFETASLDHGLIIGRAGTINLDMRIEGKSAHTGRNPENGCDAIMTAVKIINYISQFNDREKFWFTPGVINGGSARNVIADRAEVKFDIRVYDENSIQRVRDLITESLFLCDDKARAYTSVVPGIPPMTATYANTALYMQAVDVAKQRGLPMGPSIVSGGAGDAAYAVMKDIPTIDQMGVEGEFNHTENEYAVVDSLFTKTELAIALAESLDLETMAKITAAGKLES
jgi:Acetylornithine deacetylase/Succinyl-diaminopimelate desuccinylase and related deacylases